MVDTKGNPPPMLVEVRNWEGRTALRRIVPNGAPRFGTAPPYHPEPGWIIPAHDVDRDVQRDFAMAEVYPVHSSGLERLEIIGRLAQTITDLSNAAIQAETSLRNAGNDFRADKLAQATRMARATVAAIGPELLAEARAKHAEATAPAVEEG